MRAFSILHPFGIGATEHQPHPAKEKKEETERKEEQKGFFLQIKL
jgi:hypothetical protein